MNISNFGRAIAFALLGGALLASAGTLTGKEQNSDWTETEPIASASDPLQVELARCQGLKLQATNDAGCHAAWAKSLERFFGFGSAQENRPAGLLLVAPGARGAP
jgi:conjugative transfer region protein TrbK